MIRAVGIAMICLMWTQMPLQAQTAELSMEELQKLTAEGEKLFQEGGRLYQAGKYAEAVDRFERLLAIARRMYPKSSHPHGHVNIANTLNNLSLMLQSIGAYDRAKPYAEEALAMRRSMYPRAEFPDGHVDLALSANNLGVLLHSIGHYEQANGYLQEALAMRRALYPDGKFPNGHKDLAESLGNMGALLQAKGEFEQARPFYEQALTMRKSLYPALKFPQGHPEIALSLNNLGFLHETIGEFDPAKTYFQQALVMRQGLYPKEKHPNGHPSLATSLNNLGALHRSMGDSIRALSFIEQSLAMKQLLYPKEKYPNGHPDLADGLHNLAWQLHSAKDFKRAREYYMRALEMRQALLPKERFPNGHPSVAQSLASLGMAHKFLGEFKEAREYYEKALTMRKGLFPPSRYPNGHSDLVQSMNHLAALLMETGEEARGLEYLEQITKMNEAMYPRRVFPNGHRELILNHFNFGRVLLSIDRIESAKEHLEQALSMNQSHFASLLTTASEAEAMAYLNVQPRTRDAYLSLLARIPNSEARAYEVVWSTRSEVTRVLEHRQARLRAAGTKHGVQLERLRAIRRRMEQLLQERRMNQAERDSLLAKLSDERDELERLLARDLPALEAWNERDRWRPTDLIRELPPDTALIDLVSYVHLGKEKNAKGVAQETVSLQYLAFVLAPGQPIRRIELGLAEPIDSAIQSWRNRIDTKAPEGDSVLQRMIWERIRPHLPKQITRLYVVPDRDMATIPWCAFPIGSGRLLVEDFAVAVVPHGVYLLEQIRSTRRFSEVETFLALGNIDYGSTPWPALPGTAKEIAIPAPFAPGQHVVLTRMEATSKELLSRLPRARYAHLATHGFFNVEEFNAESKRAYDAVRNYQFGEAGFTGIGTKNPLGYTGLVLSHGEIVTGLRILDLPLENLKLVTLSACETGAGTFAAGEGVFGLTRAFHLAGCPNVIASLWKVNDAATAALMAKFYHEMWVNKKPPIEALREAQLTIYRHPERIPDLAGERGAVRVKEAVAAKTTVANASGSDKRADTKLWAAFILSGVGK